MGILQHQLSVWKVHQHFGASAASLPFVLGLTCLAFYLILWRLNMDIRRGSSAVNRHSDFLRIGNSNEREPQMIAWLGKGAPGHPPLHCNDGSKFERKIIQTLAGFQFDFDLLLLGFDPEPGPLGAIPGQWFGRAIDWLVIRDRA